MYLMRTRSSLSLLPFLVTISIALLRHTRLNAAASPVAPRLSFNATATGNVQCINSAKWVTSAFQPYDCFSAIGIFHDDEVVRHTTTVYEFLAANIIPIYPQFARPTPLKFTYKTCTLTIAMLADLPVDFPAPPPRRWPRTDLCDYITLGTAALNVRDGCLSIVAGRGQVGFANPVGYDRTGVHGAIGVFLWDSRSAMNALVKERVVRDRDANMTLTGVGVGVHMIDTS